MSEGGGSLVSLLPYFLTPVGGLLLRLARFRLELGEGGGVEERLYFPFFVPNIDDAVSALALLVRRQAFVLPFVFSVFVLPSSQRAGTTF